MTKKVLLVEQDARRREDGRARLTAEGFEVLTAATATEALELARQSAPEVVLSELLLRDFDGFGLCRLIRTDAALRRIPVVLTSATFDDETDQRLTRSVGANALVPQTADFGNELAAVRRGLEEGAPAGEFEPMQQISRDHLGSVSRKMSVLLARARRSEERCLRLLDHAHDAIVMVDGRGRVVEANQRCAQLLQISIDQIVGKHMSDFGAAIGGPAPLGCDGEPVPVSVRAADGSVALLEFSSVAVDIDGEAVVMAIGRDVTDKVHALGALQASEQRYRQLVENVPEVMWSANAAGQVTFITANVEKVTGLTAEEVLEAGADGWFARVDPADRDRVREAYETLLRVPGTKLDVKHRWRRKDGEVIWLHARATQRGGQEGASHVDGLFSDVTEQVQLEENLRQAQKLEAVGQLAGGVAHDFNNLLTIILSSAEFLADGFAAGDPRRELCTDIRDAACRAAALTKQLLLFSRKQAPRPELVRPEAVVSNLAKMLRRLIGEDVELVIDETGGRAGVVEIDRGHLEQVLVNLAVNARDAMPQGGRLEIRAERFTATERVLQAALPPLPAGEYVAISVSDTGTGISPEIRDRIFEPFFTTKAVGHGTGLGLATVFSILKASKGGIILESEPGRGTRFTVLLPQVADPADEAVQPPAPIARGSETVMLVEDEAMVGSVIRRILESGGYRVVEARNAREAFELLERERELRLVVSDVVMPGMSGPAMVAALRERRPGLKVVLMSGHSQHPALQSEHVDTAALVRKPTTSAELLAQVRATLDRAA